jgi:BASS family bile acid:Na+ symporter
MRQYLFTIFVFASAATAMVFPEPFRQIGGFELKRLILPLLQVIMFGMGTTLGLRDFEGVVKMPRAVAIGLVCQFTIMPLLGFSLAHVFHFPDEIAAGVVLIGCAPSGLASNVMAYIAKANLPLSITITACATLMAPICTPALMKLLGGSYVAVEFTAMMIDILKIVILPIIAGLVVNWIFRRHLDWLNRFMPKISMLGIVLIISVITAAGREHLLKVGGALFLCVLLHNLLGFLLGYWAARALRLSEQDCRTVAIEVGLQNGGLASGLALQMGKVATVGLAPALFGPIMNITGSLLANFWGARPPPEPPRRR